MRKRIVIALGGNAIQQTKEQTSAEAQQRVIAQTVRFLLDLAEQGYEMVLTHGNGPQVGTLLLQQHAGEAAGISAMPLDTCGAMSALNCCPFQSYRKAATLTRRV